MEYFIMLLPLITNVIIIAVIARIVYVIYRNHMKKMDEIIKNQKELLDLEKSKYNSKSE